MLLESYLPRLVRCFLIAGALLAPPCASAMADGPAEGLELFERRVRPILYEHCLECHGAEVQENGLRLDSRTALVAGGDRGPAVDPERPEESLLLRAVSYQDDELQMPPDGPLDPEDQRVLAEWLAAGAPWSDDLPVAEKRPVERAEQILESHWAFQPLAATPPPPVEHPEWIQTPVDRFILAGLEQAGLSPSPAADPATLVRRLYLDLLGLPPTWEEVDRFQNDTSPDAYAQLVDRLLVRREYGEQWARHWMDVARYADTKGYVDGGQSRFPYAYTYRDYLIRAFQSDIAWDQMVFDQLAGDTQPLAPYERWRMAGMGFLTVGSHFNENPHDIADDRIDVITRGLLGMTVACARCHDHKYDPISQADYYALYGILASSQEPLDPDLPVLFESSIPTESQDRWQACQQQWEEKKKVYRERFHGLHRSIQEEMRTFAGDYLRYLARSRPEHRDGLQNPLKTERTILRGPTAYGHGAFLLWQRYIDGRSEQDGVFGLWKALESLPPGDSFAQAALLYVRDSESVNRLLREAIEQEPPTTFVQLATTYGRLLEECYGQWNKAAQGDPPPSALPDPAAEQLRQVLCGQDSPCVMTAVEAAECYHLDEHVEVRNLRGEVEKVSLEFVDLAARPMLLTDRQTPVDAHLFVRGDPTRLGPQIKRRLPGILAKLDDRQGFEGHSGRRALAQAIVHPDNPLTARVLVNRVWAWHFGRPLVDSPSDFGTRSSPPSHPELLDYLSDQLIESDWSLSHLHRLILLSSTYRQSSDSRPEGRRTDPDNRLLWQFPRQRMPFEVLRDSLLAVSGRLEERSGGVPAEMAVDDPQATCRTIYLQIDRQQVSAIARAFDFPSPDLTCPQRSQTVVPQQQLFLLNSPFVIAQAQALADRIRPDEKGQTERAVVELFHQVLLRPPTDQELQRARDAVARWSSDPGGAPSQLDAWTRLAQVVLASNEFIFMD